MYYGIIILDDVTNYDKHWVNSMVNWELVAFLFCQGVFWVLFVFVFIQE